MIARIIFALAALIAACTASVAQTGGGFPVNPSGPVASSPSYLPPGANICPVGDSITYQDETETGTYAGTNYVADNAAGIGYWTQALTRGRVVYRPSQNYGVNGDTAAGVISRLPTILAGNCQIYTLMIGWNDINNGGTSLATIEANYTTIVKALIATGDPLIVITTFQGTLTGANALIQANLNSFILTLPQHYHNLYVADTREAYLVQTDTTPVANSGLAEPDGIHLVPAGGYVVYSAVAQIIEGLIPQTPPDPTVGRYEPYDATNNPYGNVLADSPFSGSGGAASGCATGTVVAGWTAASYTTTGNLSLAVCTASVVTGSDGRVWQQIKFTGTATGDSASLFYFQQTYTNVFTAGETVRASCPVQIDNGFSNMGAPAVIVYFTDNGVPTEMIGGDAGYYPLGYPISPDPFINPATTTEITISTPPYTIQGTISGTPTFQFAWYFQNASSLTIAGTFRVGDCALKQVHP